ncbi:hypothetical protein [Cardinium endosymbiont of Nabis limbatus]|uniref:hypothetical protein n=1 Tax=Cardinium endosymbiont of Nabis limbatus TaxID=3066217 RepID=UPI003AF3B117
MHKKYKQTIPCISLIVGLALFFCIPLKLKANPPTPTAYKLKKITIISTGAIEPMPRYPYLRLVKWLAPTTHPSLIYRYITLKPGDTFDAQALSCIRKQFMALPYFSTVSIIPKKVDGTNETLLFDLIIETKDRFPITIDLSLGEGPLLTITHHNAWGYGHLFSHQLFLKKRWGYGLTYALPRLDGNCLLGGQYYNQISNTYTFNYQNLWISKLCAMQQKEACIPYYWTIGLSGAKKTFATCPALSATQNRPYHNYKLILGKVGWVSDGYEAITGVYTLHGLEKLPKGGSIEMLYGYQQGAFNHRHYIGIHCIKNIANSRLKHLHLSCESGSFIHKKALEEAVLKLKLAYVGPSIQTCNRARQSIAIDYIMGYRMPKERMLGIMHRDPEALEEPDEDNRMHTPICTRLNVHLDSTLHMPIVLNAMRFVFLGFVDFIALYNQNNQLLNQTLVNSYGIGLQLAHVTIPWLAGILKIGYSPLLGKLVPSVQFSMGQFKNKTEPKPTLVAYS